MAINLLELPAEENRSEMIGKNVEFLKNVGGHSVRFVLRPAIRVWKNA